EPRCRPAGRELLRARLPVRHASWHARLHEWQRLVARRLWAVLGPQRRGAHRAVHGFLQAPGSAGKAALRRAYSLARSGGGGADAPRRLRSARSSRRRRKLRGKSAGASRFRPPRSPLVQRQPAIFENSRNTRASAHEPRADRARDPDVPRFARDRIVRGARRDCRRALALGSRIPGKTGARALSSLYLHVFLAEIIWRGGGAVALSEAVWRRVADFRGRDCGDDFQSYSAADFQFQSGDVHDGAFVRQGERLGLAAARPLSGGV